MKFKVIIPVVNRSLADALLQSMAGNTILPDSVLIIDNSLGKRPFELKADFPADVIDPGTRLGVNASWNMGIDHTRPCDYVAILNDDVVLGSRFFERNIQVFEKYPDCGVACPHTVNDPAALDADTSARIMRMKKREGWAMSFRWSLLREIPPIPEDLITFCGDDWFWVHTHMNGLCWMKDTGNVVYHGIGEAVKKLGVRSHLRQDKATFKRLVTK